MKRYSTLEEIERAPGYIPGNPVDIAIYQGLCGWYSFPEGQDVECCVRKPNGKLCEHKHRRGWVARLMDGTLTVVGGTCASKKFGADSIIAQDISRATNEIERLEKIARLEELLKGREEAVGLLARMKDSIVTAKRRVSGHLENLGSAIKKELVAMSRSNSTMVKVLGITPEVHDADGELIRDRREQQISIATLNSLAVCNPSFVESLLDDLRKLERIYVNSRATPVQDMKGKDVRALNAALADEPRILARSNEYLALVDRFELNDFTPLCFLIGEKTERVRVVRYCLERVGTEVGRDAAKAWIQTRESEMKSRFNVSVIRPQ